MNKVLSATVITLTSMFILSPIQMSSAMPETTISVEPSNICVSSMDTFTVNITVNPANQEIHGAQFELCFDNNSLNATSQTKGTFLSQDGVSTTKIKDKIDNTLGKIEYGEVRMGVNYGVTIRGTLATITFKATEPGTSSISLSNMILSDTTCSKISGVSINNGTCIIEGAEQTPTPTPTSMPTPTSSSGSGRGNGNVSVTQTPTSIPLPSGNSNGRTPLMPTQTPCLTPMQTPTTTSVPSSPALPAPAITTSPGSTTSKPLSEENKRQPGFEAVFAILTLLAISYLLLKEKGG